MANLRNPSIKTHRWALHSLVSLVFALLFSVFSLAQSAGVTVTGVRVGGDSKQTRFVLDLSGDVAFSTVTQSAPPRIVVELPGVRFDLPQDARSQVRGLVKEFRYGINNEGKSIVSIELNSTASVKKAELIPKSGKRPSRLVIDLVANEDGKKDAVGSAANFVARSRPDGGIRTIVIDPGHGGIDPGAVSPRKTREKDVVLDFGKSLRDALNRSGVYRVVMTRETDVFLSLRERVAFARQNQADLFIALHADIFRGQTARGLTVYTLSDRASDAEAEALAQKENRADIIGGVDLEHENQEVADVLIDLVQRESKNHAKLFSMKVVAEVKKVASVTSKPIRSAGFVVLKAPDVPSVLVELGYLSSREDEALLVSQQWRGKTAEAFAAAIDAYFASGAVLTTGTPEPINAAPSP